MTKWQPIETAPKGDLLLYFPKTDGRNAHPEMVRVDRYPVTYQRQPTHWIPLPPPPNQP